jgi:hypothetical protein
MYLSDEASIFHPRFLVRVEFLISWLLCAIAGTIFCVPNNCNFVSTHHLVRKYAGHRQDVRMLGSGRTGPSAFVSKVCEQRERAAADVRQMLDLDKLCCGWYSRSPISRVMLSVVLAGGGQILRLWFKEVDGTIAKWLLLGPVHDHAS